MAECNLKRSSLHPSARAPLLSFDLSLTAQCTVFSCLGVHIRRVLLYILKVSTINVFNLLAQCCGVWYIFRRPLVSGLKEKAGEMYYVMC